MERLYFATDALAKIERRLTSRGASWAWRVVTEQYRGGVGLALTAAMLFRVPRFTIFNLVHIPFEEGKRRRR